MEKPKIKVYIDGANIFYAQKKMGWSLDWRKVREYLLCGKKNKIGRENNNGIFLKTGFILGIEVSGQPI